MNAEIEKVRADMEALAASKAQAEAKAAAEAKVIAEAHRVIVAITTKAKEIVDQKREFELAQAQCAGRLVQLLESESPV